MSSLGLVAISGRGKEDQYTRWIALVGMWGYSSKAAVDSLTKWYTQNGGIVKLQMIEYGAMRELNLHQKSFKPFASFKISNVN